MGKSNAFVARLHTAAPEIIRMDLRGLFAMIEALEQPLTPFTAMMVARRDSHGAKVSYGTVSTLSMKQDGSSGCKDSRKLLKGMISMMGSSSSLDRPWKLVQGPMT